MLKRMAFLAAGMLASLAAAQTTAPAPASMPASAGAPAPELCKGAIDPYDAVAQRNKFLLAAGVDNELDEKEFAADQKKGNGFVQKFDRWEEMLKFDKNGNKTLDWFEADAYRQDLRKKVLAAFADKNGKLAGANRDAANQALDDGTIFGGPAVAARDGRAGSRDGATAGGAPMTEAELLKKYDADGDGKLSDAEREAAAKDIRDQMQKRLLEKYDTNHDGVLDDEEKKAMLADQRRQQQPWKNMFDNWLDKHFDSSGTGELSDDDKAAKAEFQKQLQELGKVWDLKMNDLDGDGVVTPEERQQVAAQWRKMTLKLMALSMRYMDADGDGKISDEERAAFNDRIREGIGGWLNKLTAKYDADGDGKLNADERAALLQGLRDEMDQRVKKYDADGKGHITPEEMLKLVQDFGAEIGVKPIAPTSSPAQEQK